MTIGAGFGKALVLFRGNCGLHRTRTGSRLIGVGRPGKKEFKGHSEEANAETIQAVAGYRNTILSSSLDLPQKLLNRCYSTQK